MKRSLEKVMHKEIMEFVYESEELRFEHVKLLEEQGWEVGSRLKRMKRGSSISDSKDENNYEWFAELVRYNK